MPGGSDAKPTADDVRAKDWRQTLADALIGAGVQGAAWVPDKRLATIGSRLADRGIPLRTLPREEECVGYAAGFRAAGGMPVVLLQCSGLGNALNALGSLAVPFGLGFPAIVSMRGALGERNPSQMPLGRSARAMFELMGIEAFTLRDPDDVEALVKGAVAVADGARTVAPILLDGILELR